MSHLSDDHRCLQKFLMRKWCACAYCMEHDTVLLSVVWSSSSMSKALMWPVCWCFWLQESRWNYLFAFLALPAILQLCVLPFLPESPRYLLMERRDAAGAERGTTCTKTSFTLDKKHQLTSGFCLQWERVHWAFIQWSNGCNGHRCPSAPGPISIDGNMILGWTG